MNNHKPTISVLIPAYNHEDYIENCIHSVWKQTYKNCQILVSDDCSPDRTFEIASRLAKESPMPMQVSQSKENIGVAASMSELLNQATGDYVAFLASDDWYMPEYLEMNLAAASQAENTVFHSGYRHFDLEMKEFHRRRSLTLADGPGNKVFWDMVDRRSTINSATVFCRRNYILRAGGFDPKLRVEDFDLHLRIARNYNISFLNFALYCKRDDPRSLGKSIEKWGLGNIDALRKHLKLDPRRLRRAMLLRYWRLASRYAEFGVEMPSEYRERCRQDIGMVQPLVFTTGRIAGTLRSRGKRLHRILANSNQVQ